MAEAVNEGKAMMDPEAMAAQEQAAEQIDEAEKQEVLEEAMSEEE